MEAVSDIAKSSISAFGVQGTAVVDFGAFPGKTDASIAITGQSGIVAGSIVRAWVRPAASTDHSADEHLIEAVAFMAGAIVAATGFTIYGLAAGSQRLYGQFNVSWSWN